MCLDREDWLTLGFTQGLILALCLGITSVSIWDLIECKTELGLDTNKSLDLTLVLLLWAQNNF